jgi:hypothetical protein
LDDGDGILSLGLEDVKRGFGYTTLLISTWAVEQYNLAVLACGGLIWCGTRGRLILFFVRRPTCSRLTCVGDAPMLV